MSHPTIPRRGGLVADSAPFCLSSPPCHSESLEESRHPRSTSLHPTIPRRGGPCGRPPSSFRPFLPVIPSPLPHVIPSPSRNLAIPHSTSLHPTIPRRGGPCGRPPSSFRPFLPVIPSPLPHVIPSPSRNLAIPRSTSLHPTIPRRGGPCGRPLRSK